MGNQFLENSGQGIVAESMRIYQLVDGRKYIWGGKTLDGFDCSGFVGYVFSNLFPEKKSHFLTDVQGFINSKLFETVDVARPGDIIVFPSVDGFVNHIGIVVDDERWIGSQSSTGVAYVKFSNRFWGKRRHYFRRLITYSAQSISSYTSNVSFSHV